MQQCIQGRYTKGFGQERVESPDGVVADRLHGAAAIENDCDVCIVLSHKILPPSIHKTNAPRN